ncbi:hypothetical protein [Rubripirellula amarantea]|nr:hypothetical protein [Rubripirellula amarantea]
MAQSTSTYESIEPRLANATQGTIEYGWPMTCFVGNIEVEAMFYSTGPRQHWAATSGGRVSPLGLVCNIGVALLLTTATYQALCWVFSSFRGKLSIATLLGLLAYVAFLFAFEAVDNVRLFDISPMTRELLIETHIFEYTERLVWASLFVTCLWLPNAVGRRIYTGNRG